MKNKGVITSGALAGLLVLFIAGAGLAGIKDNKVQGTIRLGEQSEADLPALAKISLNDAIGRALKKVQGRVLKVELENEDGFLVYGLEVAKADRSIAHVKVDAGSGKILAFRRDKADGEDREAREGRDDHEGREDRERED